MATNKHATIRYHALDRCFSNAGRKFFIDDLIKACNEALFDFTGKDIDIKRRQIFDDITFMESEQGWSIPLERIRDGRKVYYRYSGKSFSIGNKGINPSEAEQLKETLSILSRFKGLPQFEWIEEIQVRLQDTFNLKGATQKVVSFEENPYLQGLNFFNDLFTAIQNKQSLKISYKGYRQDHISEIIFHPWYLKQYNNRWFVLGLNDSFQSLSTLALDRISLIKEYGEEYKNNTIIDFEEYFEDVVGVTVDLKDPTEKIIIKISNETWPYIKSKPIHGSQKVKNRTSEHVEIQLDVQVNHELCALLFSYMDAVEIIEPAALREKFKTISESIFQKYL